MSFHTLENTFSVVQHLEARVFKIQVLGGIFIQMPIIKLMNIFKMIDARSFLFEDFRWAPLWNFMQIFKNNVGTFCYIEHHHRGLWIGHLVRATISKVHIILLHLMVGPTLEGFSHVEFVLTI